MKYIIALTDQELLRLARYKQKLRELKAAIEEVQAEADEKVAALLQEGADIVDILQVSWTAVFRRAKLDNVVPVQLEAPLIVDAQGNQAVMINMVKKEAEWIDDGNRCIGDVAISGAHHA